MVENTTRRLVWLCLIVVLAGCGYKGALKLPGPAGQTQTQPPPKQ